MGIADSVVHTRAGQRRAARQDAGYATGCWLRGLSARFPSAGATRGEVERVPGDLFDCCPWRRRWRHGHCPRSPGCSSTKTWRSHAGGECCSFARAAKVSSGHRALGKGRPKNRDASCGRWRGGSFQRGGASGCTSSAASTAGTARAASAAGSASESSASSASGASGSGAREAGKAGSASGATSASGPTSSTGAAGASAAPAPSTAGPR
mmetsp:Transcript_30123/g.65750  ORF Transcript_30123/g.65750 Transcript_30123/m.65750 type:complete len:209 (-) Transcript_30123:1063-1689(-)